MIQLSFRNRLETKYGTPLTKTLRGFNKNVDRIENSMTFLCKCREMILLTTAELSAITTGIQFHSFIVDKLDLTPVSELKFDILKIYSVRFLECSFSNIYK